LNPKNLKGKVKRGLGRSFCVEYSNLHGGKAGVEERGGGVFAVLERVNAGE
jgi:hypothetical protein